MSKASELLPCPFCGGEADYFDDGCIGYAYCMHCLVRTDDFYSWRKKDWKEVAAQEWNTRVVPKENDLYVHHPVTGERMDKAQCKRVITQMYEYIQEQKGKGRGME